MNYNELAKEIHENAVNHGWWEEERSYGEIVALISSELSEALEEARDGKPNVYCKHFDSQNWCNSCMEFRNICCYSNEKPEGVAVELADAMIRILDYLGKMGHDIDGCELTTTFKQDNISLGDFITHCNAVMTKPYIMGQHNDDEYRIFCLMAALNMIEKYIGHIGEDAEQLIKLKREYNKSRPYRHGGKKL